MSTAAAYFTALLGNFLLSLGFSLQKKHVSWLSAKRRGEKVRQGEVIGWTSGFILMNLQPIFNYLALGVLPPNVVAAIGGSNIIFTIVLSYWMLGEKPHRRKSLGLSLWRLCWRMQDLWDRSHHSILMSMHSGLHFSSPQLLPCSCSLRVDA